MDIVLKKSTVTDGTIVLPSSKSISNRVLIIRALSGSDFVIDNLSDCDDTQVMLSALLGGGSKVDIGAAGTAMRFLTAYFAQKSGAKVEITGSERMKQRPIRILVDALMEMGAAIRYAGENGFPPLKIKGTPLKGGDLYLKGSVSSQYISAVMLIAPYLQRGLRIELVPPVVSLPYILMTQQLMREFGAQVEFDGSNIAIAPTAYTPHAYVVESDWSAASYWYEVLALRGEGSYFLAGLHKKSTQGDAQVAKFFSRLGITTTYEEGGVRIEWNGRCNKRLNLNLVEQPDLAQTLVVTCCFMGVPFHFTGLQNLKIKETDRIAALMAEMRKFGYVLVEPREGELKCDACRAEVRLSDVSVSTYNDHRMAMAFAPVALREGLTIKNAEVVSKSYPNFWNDLKQVSFDF